MADFKEQFTPQNIDQQLEPPPVGAERNQRIQFLSELHRFHNAATSAEKRSIASAWARIEARSGVQQTDLSEKSPLLFPLPESRREISPQFRPREPKKRRLATLAAVLAALVLIGVLPWRCWHRGARLWLDNTISRLLLLHRPSSHSKRER